MFPKYLFAFCVLAFVVVVNAASDDSAPVDEEPIIAEPRNPLLAVAVRLIAKELGKRAGKCLVEAAEACRSDWKHAHALVECAKKFAESNKGRCLA